MASDEVSVKYEVRNPNDIPLVGQRKTVRVNGRPETLYVKDLTAHVVIDWEDDGRGGSRQFRSYYGTITLTPHNDLYR